jgi:alpha-glucosidase
MVPNHTSDEHVWFKAALAAAPGSPERARYLFRDGRGPDGDLPPNDWESNFGGPAWTRTTNPDGTPGQWYLHLFAPGQPDLDWRNPEVRAEFESVLRFWFDRGVDGFRIDVAHGLVKHEELVDVGELSWPLPEQAGPEDEHPFWDRSELHDIYRAWRAVADSYEPKRVFAAEAWVPRPHRLARYLREDELHTAFNFDFLVQPWLAAPMRETIDATLAAHASVGAPATWVLSNHDVAREVSRYARPQSRGVRTSVDDLLPLPADFDLGLRRARAAALLILALPGGAYVYQGEELGLPEVEDIPLEARQDPTVFQTHGERLGRDGCRVPLPWSAEGDAAGFSPVGAAAPWLPQPAGWADRSVEAQSGVPGSTLELYRAALATRRQEPALGDGTLEWLELGEDVLAFRRDPGFACVVNFGAEPVALPDGAEVLLASDEPVDGRLPADTAVWLRVPLG